MSQASVKVSREPSHMFRGVGDNVPKSAPPLVVFNPRFASRVYRKRRKEELAARIKALKETPIAVPASMPSWAKEVIAHCCRQHDVAIDMLLSADKRKTVTWCRFEIYYLLWTNERRPSLAQIGIWLERDHTTVKSGIERWKQRIG